MVAKCFSWLRYTKKMPIMEYIYLPEYSYLLVSVVIVTVVPTNLSGKQTLFRMCDPS